VRLGDARGGSAAGRGIRRLVGFYLELGRHAFVAPCKQVVYREPIVLSRRE